MGRQEAGGAGLSLDGGGGWAGVKDKLRFAPAALRAAP
jgi:hypothetical protein